MKIATRRSHLIIAMNSCSIQQSASLETLEMYHGAAHGVLAIDQFLLSETTPDVAELRVTFEETTNALIVQVKSEIQHAEQFIKEKINDMTLNALQDYIADTREKVTYFTKRAECNYDNVLELEGLKNAHEARLKIATDELQKRNSLEEKQITNKTSAPAAVEGTPEINTESQDEVFDIEDPFNGVTIKDTTPAASDDAQEKKPIVAEQKTSPSDPWTSAIESQISDARDVVETFKQYQTLEENNALKSEFTAFVETLTYSQEGWAKFAEFLAEKKVALAAAKEEAEKAGQEQSVVTPLNEGEVQDDYEKEMQEMRDILLAVKFDIDEAMKQDEIDELRKNYQAILKNKETQILIDLIHSINPQTGEEIIVKFFELSERVSSAFDVNDSPENIELQLAPLELFVDEIIPKTLNRLTNQIEVYTTNLIRNIKAAISANPDSSAKADFLDENTLRKTLEEINALDSDGSVTAEYMVEANKLLIAVKNALTNKSDNGLTAILALEDFIKQTLPQKLEALQMKKDDFMQDETPVVEEQKTTQESPNQELRNQVKKLFDEVISEIRLDNQDFIDRVGVELPIDASLVDPTIEYYFGDTDEIFEETLREIESSDPDGNITKSFLETFHSLLISVKAALDNLDPIEAKSALIYFKAFIESQRALDITAPVLGQKDFTSDQIQPLFRMYEKLIAAMNSLDPSEGKRCVQEWRAVLRPFNREIAINSDNTGNSKLGTYRLFNYIIEKPRDVEIIANLINYVNDTLRKKIIKLSSEKLAKQQQVKEAASATQTEASIPVNPSYDGHGLTNVDLETREAMGKPLQSAPKTSSEKAKPSAPVVMVNGLPLSIPTENAFSKEGAIWYAEQLRQYNELLGKIGTWNNRLALIAEYFPKTAEKLHIKKRDILARIKAGVEKAKSGNTLFDGIPEELDALSNLGEKIYQSFMSISQSETLMNTGEVSQQTSTASPAAIEKTKPATPAVEAKPVLPDPLPAIVTSDPKLISRYNNLNRFQPVWNLKLNHLEDHCGPQIALRQSRDAVIATIVAGINISVKKNKPFNEFQSELKKLGSIGQRIKTDHDRVYSENENINNATTEAPSTTQAPSEQEEVVAVADPAVTPPSLSANIVSAQTEDGSNKDAALNALTQQPHRESQKMPPSSTQAPRFGVLDDDAYAEAKAKTRITPSADHTPQKTVTSSNGTVAAHTAAPAHIEIVTPEDNIARQQAIWDDVVARVKPKANTQHGRFSDATPSSDSRSTTQHGTSATTTTQQQMPAAPVSNGHCYTSTATATTSSSSMVTKALGRPVVVSTSTSSSSTVSPSEMKDAVSKHYTQTVQTLYLEGAAVITSLSQTDNCDTYSDVLRDQRHAALELITQGKNADTAIARMKETVNTLELQVKKSGLIGQIDMLCEQGTAAIDKIHAASWKLNRDKKREAQLQELFQHKEQALRAVNGTLIKGETATGPLQRFVKSVAGKSAGFDDSQMAKVVKQSISGNPESFLNRIGGNNPASANGHNHRPANPPKGSVAKTNPFGPLGR